MGANDAKEMLEVAKQECLRLERENTDLREVIRLGTEQLEAIRRGQAVSLPDQDVRGWLVVDKTTRALDWDGVLHPTEEAARASLDEDRRFNDPDWKPFEIYDILPVLAALSPASIPEIPDNSAAVDWRLARSQGYEELATERDFTGHMDFGRRTAYYEGFKLGRALSTQPAAAVTSDTSDGHHTFAELYEYRMLYNAHAAQGWLTSGIPVVKSWRHSDGELAFGGGWFVVVAQLSTGQVTNHYKGAHWGLFDVPEVEKAPTWDGHTPAIAAERLGAALLSTQPAAGEVEWEYGWNTGSTFMVIGSREDAEGWLDLFDAKLGVGDWGSRMRRRRRGSEPGPWMEVSPSPAPELFPGTLAALDNLNIRPEVQ